MADEASLTCLIQALQADNLEVKKYAIRILGNIAADQPEHVEALHREGLLDHLFPLFLASNSEVRRDTCWLVANLCCERISATRVMRQQMVMAKLVDLFENEEGIEIQRELTHIFAYLAHNAERS